MKKSGMVFVSTLFDRGWSAYINGSPGKVIRVNNAFCGVFLQAGTHELHMIFEPFSFKLGLYISLIGIVSVFFMITVSPVYRGQFFRKLHFRPDKSGLANRMNYLAKPWVLMVIFLILIGISILSYPRYWQRSFKSLQPTSIQELKVDIRNL